MASLVVPVDLGGTLWTLLTWLRPQRLHLLLAIFSLHRTCRGGESGSLGGESFALVSKSGLSWPCLEGQSGLRARGQERPGEACWPCSHRTLVLHEASPSRWLLLRQHHRKAAVCEPPTCWHSGLLGGAGAGDLPSSTGDNRQQEAKVSSADSGALRPGCV